MNFIRLSTHPMGKHLLDEGADVAAAPAQDPHRTLVSDRVLQQSCTSSSLRPLAHTFS
jgi:hypothetical protein